MHGFLPKTWSCRYARRAAAPPPTTWKAVAHAVLAGTHLGYLPTHYAEAWIERGRMRALLPGG